TWVEVFGGSFRAALYALVGFAAWIVPVVLLFWGWRRFWQRPVENPGSKAAGLALLFLSVPTLLSLALGKRLLFGEEAESGGVVGRAAAQALRGRLGTAGRAPLPRAHFPCSQCRGRLRFPSPRSFWRCACGSSASGAASTWGGFAAGTRRRRRDCGAPSSPSTWRRRATRASPWTRFRLPPMSRVRRF